jgi:preprotein translocase subunit SecD
MEMDTLTVTNAQRSSGWRRRGACAVLLCRRTLAAVMIGCVVLTPACSKGDEPGKKSAESAQEFLSATGGATYLVKIIPGEGKEVSLLQRDNVIQTLRNRFKAAGYQDVKVVAEGKDQLMVGIPGIAEKAVAKALPIIEKSVKVEFRLTEDRSVMFTTKDDPGIRPGFVKMRHPDRYDTGDAKAEADKWIWVKNKAALSGNMVSKAFHDINPGALDYHIVVVLREEFAEKMRTLTKANVGQPLAIVFDGEVLSAPTIMSEFGERFDITGRFTEQQARELSIQLANPLENALKIEKSSFVPPGTAPKKP